LRPARTIGSGGFSIVALAPLILVCLRSVGAALVDLGVMMTVRLRHGFTFEP
jgi:hypothetical protein